MPRKRKKKKLAKNETFRLEVAYALAFKELGLMPRDEPDWVFVMPDGAEDGWQKFLKNDGKKLES